MNLSTIKTPGVYINEINTIPNSVVPVATSVPAFIGYTPQAMHQGKSCINVPTKISSFAEFQAIFCLPTPPSSVNPAKQYNPQYYLVKQESQPNSSNHIMIADNYYAIVPDPNTIYYLYNSIKLFFDNGGSNAYIVSVGSYGATSGKAAPIGNQIVNPNVKIDDLTKGLALLKKEQEPTMYICPEATLLSVENNATLMQEMLSQASKKQTAICIFDIIGGKTPHPNTYIEDISAFRNATGSTGLDYGAAYYPFVETTVQKTNDINYTNLFGGDLNKLQEILSPESNPNESVNAIIDTIRSTSSEHALTAHQYNSLLIAASPIYSTIMTHILSDANLLPPSGGMAGVITRTDNQLGPWKAPANVAMNDVINLPINLTNAQQEVLNVDIVSGKSINAIRFFNRAGILVWGAKTLDGNSPDWRYLSVRRTVIFLEQSCKVAAMAYVFEPNDYGTWESVKSMISSFLYGIWKQGGLQGATPEDAFSVECGLGSTMTEEDILNGIMKVSITVAPIRPAEFIVFTFQQKMASSN